MTKAIMMIPFSSNPTTGSKIKNPVSAEFFGKPHENFLLKFSIFLRNLLFLRFEENNLPPRT